MKKASLIMVLLGVVGIFVGVLEYVTGRAALNVYFLNNFTFSKFLADHSTFAPHIYGRLGQWVPDFFHAFSFSLISIGLFSTSRFSRAAFCILWFGIDALFEIGQRYGVEIAPYIPSWFNKMPFLENTKNYFLNGRFDKFDIVAFFLGGLGAYVIAELLIGGIRYGEARKGRGEIRIS